MLGRLLLALCALLAGSWPSSANAQTPRADPADGDSATVRAGRVPSSGPGRSASLVTRRELEERLPRSTPEALRFIPGVAVQQTAHGQASAYVRGLTGQQVLLMFDGVRLNNGTWRQGPNQYFFTVDAQSLDRLEVLRGSASTLWGSDALGGVVLASPTEPSFAQGPLLRPSLSQRASTADDAVGWRGEAEVTAGQRLAAIVGGGYRSSGLLRAGGPVHDLATGAVPMVPLFAPDGYTQLGTGFREATFDGRVVARLGSSLRAIGAVYGYRQYDAPRTDQCPPPFAPQGECLTLEEQFRTLAYVALRGDAGPVQGLDVVASYQRQHERRRHDRPLSFARNGGVDDVDTLGLAFRASTRAARLGGGDDSPRAVSLRLRYGGDVYHDTVASAAWIAFTDVNILRAYPRGQYLDGASYLLSGLFAEAELSVGAWLRVRAGGRLAMASASAPADVESGSRGVDRTFGALVGRAGVELRALPGLTLLANVDQGFRAPNLDDLTSRQQAGPGFQFENADLAPERSVTWELGARASPGPFDLELWGWALSLDGALTRSLRAASDCPPRTPACLGSWSRYQLINATGTSWLLGGEAAARAELPFGLGFAATAFWAWGEGPDPSVPGGTVPLSRVPPLQGTLEVRYRWRRVGLQAGAALRWATEQTRLAPSDLGDARIPRGGTPGYAVFEVRLGWRMSDRVRFTAVLENLFDTPYRVHGSGVNGPGRGLLLSATLGI